jgi:hypothetical protein
MNWPEDIYEIFGANYPTLSLVVVTVFGAVLFGGGWWVIGQKYKKHHSAQPLVTQMVEGKNPIDTPPQLRPTPQVQPTPHRPKPKPKPEPEHPSSPAPNVTPEGNPRPLPVSKLSFTQEITNSTRENAPFAVRVVIQTNTAMQPTSLVLRCSSDVEEGSYRMVGVSAYRDSGNGYVGNSRSNFWFFFGDPPFTPERPIVAVLMSKQPVNVISVEEGPPR